MTFISYAQNLEDVILWRALKHIKQGFYIDVGANDPIIDSITKAFYDRGWRGINIEPIRHWHDKLMVDRPQDLNLNVAISDQPGLLRFYDIQDTGLSTSDKDIAEKHSEELGFQHQEIMVPALTLDNVLQEFNRDIHFLKVDVEGAEKQVLASMDLTRTKPWIILVEATKPFSQEQNYKDWEAILIDSGYIFVYFDGLNRFYVSADKNELIPAFESPPNVFDDFIQFKHWNTQTRLHTKEAEWQQLDTALSAKEIESANLRAALDNLSTHYQNALNEIARLLAEHDKEVADRVNLQAELNAREFALRSVYSSTSWKITAPVRFSKTVLTTIIRLPLRGIKAILAGSVRFMRAHSGIKGKLVRLFSHFPMIDRQVLRLSRRVMNEPIESPVPALVLPVVDESPNLALRARQIHKDLLDAIEKKKQEGN